MVICHFLVSLVAIIILSLKHETQKLLNCICRILTQLPLKLFCAGQVCKNRLSNKTFLLSFKVVTWFLQCLGAELKNAPTLKKSILHADRFLLVLSVQTPQSSAETKMRLHCVFSRKHRPAVVEANQATRGHVRDFGSKSMLLTKMTSLSQSPCAVSSALMISW